MWLCWYENTAGNNEGGGEIYRKNTSSLHNHVLHWHAKELGNFLALLELWKTSQPEDASEIITDKISIKHRNSDKLSIGGRLSDYLLLCHLYGDNHPNQREFGGYDVTLMAHTFTLLSLVNHECFRMLTKYINLQLWPVGRSKLSQSLILT